MTKYNYTVSGIAASGATWETSGAVDLPGGLITRAVEQALRESILKVTRGDAVYHAARSYDGPGPFRVTRLVLERAHDP